MSPSRTEVIPSARRLIQSLRDLGYDLTTAVADLVDNSIAAGAVVVEVETHFDGDDSWIRISDDGSGMTRSQLNEAMRFGTRRDYDDDDLGKFGLGLKAASLSQCRCLTVASRTTPAARINAAQWDLDFVEETDRWEVLNPTPRESRLATQPLREVAGTVVLWEGLDRIFRYQIPEGKRAKSDFDKLARELAQHLSMVFHRFLSREAGRRLPLTIRVNGVDLSPWDPFARSEAATIELPNQRLRFMHDSTKHVVDVRPYVLPTEACFSSSNAHREAAGPRLWNRQQGFYIYRGGRMIQSGGWNRLRTSDEHTKLARVRVDLPPGSEEPFELNISKTQVRIPSALRPSLAAVASSVTRAAQTSYRGPVAEPPEPSRPVQPTDRDPRVTALRALVRLVLGGVEGVLREEVADSHLLADIIDRLNAMEDTFMADVDRELAREIGAPAHAQSRMATNGAHAGIAGAGIGR